MRGLNRATIGRGGVVCSAMKEHCVRRGVCATKTYHMNYPFRSQVLMRRQGRSGWPPNREEAVDTPIPSSGSSFAESQRTGEGGRIRFCKGGSTLSARTLCPPRTTPTCSTTTHGIFRGGRRTAVHCAQLLPSCSRCCESRRRYSRKASCLCACVYALPSHLFWTRQS